MLMVEFDIKPINDENRFIYSVLDAPQETHAVAGEANSLGYGVFRVRNRGDRIVINTQFWNTDDVVGAHLHLGARDENGPIVVDLRASSTPNADKGVDLTIKAHDLSGPLEGLPLQALLAEIDAGNIYINVHTVENGPGEMRGQLVP
jgi:hypothetical protein